MKRITGLVLILSTLSLGINAQEWTELFNGKNFKGWESWMAAPNTMWIMGRLSGLRKPRPRTPLWPPRRSMEISSWSTR